MLGIAHWPWPEGATGEPMGLRFWNSGNNCGLTFHGFLIRKMLRWPTSALSGPGRASRVIATTNLDWQRQKVVVRNTNFLYTCGFVGG